MGIKRTEMDYSEDAAIFSILAKPRCLHILSLLREHHELCVNDLLDLFSEAGIFLEQATLSQYLSLLMEAGLIGPISRSITTIPFSRSGSARLSCTWRRLSA